MPISSTTNRVSYVGDGSSTVFPFAYEFFNQADLKVFLYNSSAGTIAAQTLNTHFTIGGTANAQGVYTLGGSVITTCAIPTALMLVITRDPSQVQNYTLLQNGNINAQALVNQLDYLTLLVQRLQDEVGRATRLKDGYGPTFDNTLPPMMVASSVVITNSSANGWAMGPTAGEIANAQSSAILALTASSDAAAFAASAFLSVVAASTSEINAAASAVLAASAAVSAGSAVALVGSTAFWAVQAQSSAVSASNQAVLAGSAAVSAGNLVVLANSAAVSAGNQTVLSTSAAISATNQAILAAASALSASSAVGALTLPLAVASGGTGTQGGAPFQLAYWNGSSAMAAVTAPAAGQTLQGGTSNVPTWGSPLFFENILVNGAFDWWQAFPAGSSVANAGRVYFADQWYVSNDLGTNGVITCTPTSGQLGGSIKGCKVQITTAPTAAQVNGTELWQVIENPILLSRIMGQSTAFTSAMIKSLGNVTQIGIQFFQAGAEVKTTAVSSSVFTETLVTVNSANFTACGSASAFSFGGYVAGSSGVVGMRIRITGVSTGSAHVLNNGFIVEQAGFWAGTGSVQPQWARRNANPDLELALCQRFYEKSYSVGEAPGLATLNGLNVFMALNTSGGQQGGWTSFRVKKRALAPTMTIYDGLGASGKWGNINNAGGWAHGVTIGGIPDTPSDSSFRVISTSGAWGIGYHWTADSRI